MRQKIGRRDFLRQGACAAAAALAVPAGVRAAHPRGFGRAYAPRKVVVLGAGLAGLAAGYELTKAGHDVRVLEAQERPGGRVLTLRGFDGAHYADAGAARIPEEHEWTLRYVKEFGLPLAPFYPEAGLFVRLKKRRRAEVNWKKFRDAVEDSVGVILGEARSWHKIDGGNDLLPRAFAERLAGRITYGAPVSKVEQDSGGVRVTFGRGGAAETLAADYAVCAIPFAVLNRVEFAPPLSERKRKVRDQLTYELASRAFIQTRGRYWEAGRTNGFAVTDLPAEIWPASFGQTGARGLLQSYLRHGASLEAAKLDAAGRIAASLERMEQVLPGAGENFESGASKFWHEDEWARGAWGLAEDDEELARVVRPEGRTHFAGEHASRWPSWMQGALESGHRAAREVAEAARKTSARAYPPQGLFA